MDFKKYKFDFSSHYPIIFTLFFILIIFQYPLTTLEAILYDLRVKLDFGTKASPEIVLVTIDHESDEYLGDIYPYTYTTHLRHFEKLKKTGAKQVLFFTQFRSPTPDELSSLEQFKKSISEFNSRGGIVRLSSFMDEKKGEIIPPIEIQELGFSLGQLNIDNMTFARDDVPRRAILNVSGEESIHLWSANQIRAEKNLPPLKISDFVGSYYNDEADANFALFRYSTNPQDGKMKYKSIPFHRVLVGNFNPDFFKDKIVLVGPTYYTQREFLSLSPFNQEEYSASKLAIHANILDAFIQQKTVKALPRIVSQFISIFLALLLSIIISKLSPRDGLIITALMLLSVVILSFLLFSLLGFWLYTAHLLVTVFVVYYIWIPFRAIGEYQRRFAIQEETKLLKKVENLKQNFISLMSHDLKTPVAKIQGLADTLIRQYPQDPEIKNRSHLIVEATKELNKFITSILDLTKIESSNFGLNKVSKDINLLIDEVISDLKYEAQNKSISLEKELSPLYPISLDINLTKRVISNLIENALKYAGPGTTVKVTSWDDTDWVYVEIKDNGVGIPPEEINHIFEKFYRIKNDASHSIKGSGLGLYLVKYFVELHGGTISVTSIPKTETKFLVKFKNLS